MKALDEANRIPRNKNTEKGKYVDLGVIRYDSFLGNSKAVALQPGLEPGVHPRHPRHVIDYTANGILSQKICRNRNAETSKERTEIPSSINPDQQTHYPRSSQPDCTAVDPHVPANFTTRGKSLLLSNSIIIAN